MKRETATHWEDLPHRFVGDVEKAADAVLCRCGRETTDALHATPREYASTPVQLVTEKGS